MTISREVQDAAADPKRRLNHYVLVSPVGSGGAGQVWRSWDTRLNRWVAVKLLREGVGASQRNRFLREAQATAALRHPNLITIHDFGDVEGRLFLVMEYIPGKILDLAGPLKEVVSKLHQVAAALETAHRSGVVHRDLKPGNIVVDEAGIPHVVDFGLAHWIDTDLQITQVGSTLGTPQYMSPEQAAGRIADIGPATDVYSMGVMLYEALAHRPMFETQNAGEFIASIINKEPAPPPGPRDLVAICLKAVEKRPERRYRSIRDFATDLEAFLEDRPVQARPVHPLVRRFRSWRGRRVAIFALAAALVVAAATWWAVTSSRQMTRESAAREELERERKFSELNRAIEMKIADLRKDVYIAGIDIHASQARLEKELADYERGATSAGFSAEPAFWKLLGGGWYLIGDHDRAFVALQKAQQLAPADAAVAGDLGRVYLQRIQLGMLRFGITADSVVGTGDGARMLALAQACFKVAIAGASDDKQRDLMEIYAVAAKLEPATDACDIAIRKYGRSPGVEEFHIVKGMLASTHQDLKGAIFSFTTALEIRPHDERPFLWRGVARLRGNEFSEAIADFERVAVLNPRLAEGWLLQGLARMKMNDFAGARQAYTDGLSRLSPDDPRRVVGLNNRAYVANAAEDLGAAIADWTEVIRLNPGIAEVFRDRGRARFERGEIEPARADFEEALRINPRYARAMSDLARLHWKEAPGESVLQEFISAFDLSPLDEWVRSGLDNALQDAWEKLPSQGDLLATNRSALAQIERIVLMHGEWGRFHYYLGHWHQQVGIEMQLRGSMQEEAAREFEQAVEALIKAEQLNKEPSVAERIPMKRASTYRSWALTLSVLGRNPAPVLEKAVADFEAVIKGFPTLDEPRMNRAFLYLDWGKFERASGRDGRPYFLKAEEDAKKAELLNPTLPRCRELVEEIRRELK